MTHSPYVTTIIAPDKASLLSQDDINSMAERLNAIGADCVETDWLEEDTACDIYHTQLPNADLLTPLHGEIQETGDIVTQPMAHRHKKLLISDMDSTMIHQECIDELADYLGIKDKVAMITERAMNDELDFKQALRERVKLLEGLPTSALEEVYDTRISLMDGAKTLISTMKAHGAYCVLVSGGFRFFTSKVTESLGFDEHHSNTLGVIDAKLNGEVIDPILDKDTKEMLLTSIADDHGIDPADTLAIGDGANDVPMLLTAGMGIAYRARPVVRQQVNAQIIHHDLSAVLYLQGYKKSDWIL